jgi:hypothetical protein
VIKDSQEGFTDTAILMDDNGNAVAVWIQPFKKTKRCLCCIQAKKKKKPGRESLSKFPIIDNQAEQAQLSFHNGVFVVVWGRNR